eukprot:gene13398-28409_t
MATLDVTTTFYYTGIYQSYTVPTGVSSLTVYACGGQGGTNANNYGGYGGCIRSLVIVTPNQLLYVMVGGSGDLPTAGYNGGGAGKVYRNEISVVPLDMVVLQPLIHVVEVEEVATMEEEVVLFLVLEVDLVGLVDLSHQMCKELSQEMDMSLLLHQLEEISYTGGYWNDNVCSSSYPGLCRIPNLCWKSTANIDRTGNDINHYTYTSYSVDQCKEVCYNDPSCVAMVYKPSTNECWTKSSSGS